MADRLLCTLGEAFGEDYNESIERVTPEEVELLQLRTGQVVSEICSKHRKLYLQHYSLGQKKCCDPLENHPTKIMVRSLRVITPAMAEKWSTEDVRLVPGKKLCTCCRKQLSRQAAPCTSHHDSDIGAESDGEVDEASNSDSFGDEDVHVSTQLSALLVSISESPIVKKRMLVKSYADDKMRRIKEGIRKVLGLEPSKVEEDFKEMILQLKHKFDDSEKVSEKVQVLTVLPQSWSIRRIQEEFGATYRTARLSKQLAASEGIMATPNARLGKVLPKAVEEKVVAFYLSDNVSRMMPGSKDYVSMYIHGKKERVQKRLLLFSLKDAYLQFLDENVGLKIGLTKFKEFRPRNVILAGASGSHNVCVCTTHQNVKLMIEGSKVLTLEGIRRMCGEDGDITYKHLLASLLCKPALPACYLGTCALCGNIESIADICSHCDQDEECPSCTKVTHLKKVLVAGLEEQCVDSVSYKAWVSVDHTTLVTITQTADIFVDSLVEYLLKLRKHDFIAKEQAAFLVEKKSSLQEGEIVVLGDFAENYSFVIQDAVQGFHWNNTQATIHPFVAYYDDAVRGEVCFLNFVIISDSLTHDSVAVHCFVKKLLTFLVTKLTVKKVYYFSDGAASQYKNKKNFVNLAFHNRDFKNIEAEWHFFATAHGKGPCDGLGGTVKREAVRASLKRPLEGQIQTPQELSEWAKDAIPSVTFEFVDKSEVEAEERALQERLDAAVTIEGTQSYHAYYQLKDCTNKLMVKTYSRSLSSEIVQISNHREPIPIDDVGGYVICQYGGAWWLAPLFLKQIPMLKK